MKDIIIQKLKEIESEDSIKIVFAIESGSRVWGMEGTDSDYDIRFVYARPIEDYITVGKKSDTIMRAYDKEGKSQAQEGCIIDVQGMDIIKYAKLLSSSNPTAIEWLKSDILYYGEQPKVFQDFAYKKSNPKTLYYHYKSLCKNNYKKYLSNNTDVTTKRYLYCMRGLVNSLLVKRIWIPPPIKFEQALVDAFDLEEINEETYNLIMDKIKEKKGQKEKKQIPRCERSDKFIEVELEKDEAPDSKRVFGTNKDIDDEIRKHVLGWR